MSDELILAYLTSKKHWVMNEQFPLKLHNIRTVEGSAIIATFTQEYYEDEKVYIELIDIMAWIWKDKP